MDAGLGDPSDADPDDTQFRTAWQQYKLLVEICPHLTDEIQAHSVEEASSIMENARASGRGEDIKRKRQGELRVQPPSDWAAAFFLYEDDKVDPNNLLSGFLRSEILVHAYCVIMIGPSAIEGRGPSARATKKGNAQLNNMNDISIASLST
ncbi:hypothetical protein JB92DRAFT_2831532 [Gautieria morchelliformis]|nr:hypothetical protein JB92DRAFT_2831532 [Gautieria morchelliformis]